MVFAICVQISYDLVTLTFDLLTSSVSRP